VTDPADTSGAGASEPAVLEALRSALDEHASASGAVDRAETPQGVEYRVGDLSVAYVDGRSVAFLVGESIASAAARTADAGPSPRGAGWVELRPSALDRFTLDRATSWFDLAVRRAGESAIPG
jgi:hypothetical protein